MRGLYRTLSGVSDCLQAALKSLAGQTTCTTWRCQCGEVIYRPALAEDCRLLNGRASTRRAQ
jgi:hypothetical protein